MEIVQYRLNLKIVLLINLKTNSSIKSRIINIPRVVFTEILMAGDLDIRFYPKCLSQ